MPTINPVLYAELLRVAKAGGTITYGDLGRTCDLVPGRGADAQILDLALDEIADQETANGRPLLPAVVITDGGHLPGARLFEHAKRRHRQIGDDPTYHAAELRRVYDYWASAAGPAAARARVKGHRQPRYGEPPVART